MSVTRCQLRRYVVKPGEMADFTEVFFRDVVPLREQYGFTVLGVWRPDGGDEFVWIVGAGDDFAELDARYYASPERAALPVDPASFLASVDLQMMDVVPGPQPG